MSAEFKSRITSLKEMLVLLDLECRNPIGRKFYMVSQDGMHNTYSVTSCTLKTLYTLLTSTDGTFVINYHSCSVTYYFENTAIIFLDYDEAREYAKQMNAEAFQAFFASAELNDLIAKDATIKELESLMDELQKNGEVEKAKGVYRAIRTVAKQKATFESTKLEQLYALENKYTKEGEQA